MPPLKVLVMKLHTVDRSPSRSIKVCKIAALNHESWYHSVEWAAVVAVALLHCAQSSKVLRSFRYKFIVESECDAAGLFSSDSNLEVHFGHDETLNLATMKFW